MKIITSSAIVSTVCVLLLHGLSSNVLGLNQRILNGDIADPSSYKFIVQLNYHRHGMDWRCGGSVIDPYFILTAAHCLYGRECDEIEIAPSDWIAGDGPTYWASRCHIHDLYSGGKFYNDIALVETSEHLLRNWKIVKIELPHPGTVYSVGTAAVIVGWGQTEDRVYPDVLIRANVFVSNWARCNQDFQNVVECGDDIPCPSTIPAHSFCTQGKPPRISGTCVGDSGGPVIIDGILAGLSSGVILSNNECEIGTPSLHINVADFIPWIMTYI